MICDQGTLHEHSLGFEYQSNNPVLNVENTACILVLCHRPRHSQSYIFVCFVLKVINNMDSNMHVLRMVSIVFILEGTIKFFVSLLVSVYIYCYSGVLDATVSDHTIYSGSLFREFISGILGILTLGKQFFFSHTPTNLQIGKTHLPGLTCWGRGQFT